MKDINQKKKKSKILSILGWIFLGFFVLIFFISISLVTINNFPVLRKPVLHTIIGIVNSSLIAKIEIEDLKFKSHNRIWVKNFALITAGDTLAKFEQLDVKISITALLNNKIIIRYLKLKEPTIKLLRSSKDLKWNFEKIAPPSEPSAPGKSPIVKIQYLELTDAKFILKDSTFSSESLPFNPLDILLSGLYIKMNANLDLDASKFTTNIERITFFEEKTGFRADSLRFAGYLDTTQASISNLHLYMPDSKIIINAEILNYSPLSVEKFSEFSNATFKLQAEAENFNTSSLKKFVYVPFNENVKADFTMNAIGTTTVLQFDKLNLKLQDSYLSTTGKLKNFNSNKIIYDFVFKNSNVREKDLKALLNIDLSSIPEFKNAQFKTLSAIGDVDKVSAEFDLLSDIGNISGKSRVEYYPNFVFDGDVVFSKVNFAPILQNPEMTSDISGSANFDGKGYDPSKMTANIDLSLQNSIFEGRNISDFITAIQMDNGLINIETLNASFREPNEFSGTPFALSSQLEIKGNMNIKDLNNPKYSFLINTKGINLAKLFQNKEFPVSITSKININGDGLDPDSLQLSLHSAFEEITFKNLSFLPIDLNLEVKSKENNEKEIELKLGEDFIKINGQIEITKFLNSLSGWIEYASLLIDTRYEQFIQKKFNLEKENRLNFLASENVIPPINAVIQIKLGSLSILNKFIPDFNIISSLETTSSIITTKDNILFDFTDFRFGNTILNTGGLRLETDNFTFSGVLDIGKTDSLINLSYFNMSLDNLDAINLNGLEIKQPVVDIFIADSTFIIDLSAKFDTIASASISMNGKLNRDNISIDFTKINMDYLKKIQLKNNDIGRIKIDNNSFLIDNFRLNGNNNELVAINGFADTNSIKNLVIEASNIHLKNFKYLLPDGIKDLISDLNVHLKEAKFEISGTLESPIYNFKLNVDEILSRNKQIGFLMADFNYLEKNLTGNMQLLNNDLGEIPPLNFEIVKLPIDLSFTRNFGKLNGEYLAKMSLDSLNLQLAESFQPYLKNIKGTANAQISVSGTDEKDYKMFGTFNTSDMTFKLIQNNIDYSLSTHLTFNNQTIKIDTLNIVNFGTKSNAKLNGTVDLAGNKLSFFDLNLKADNFILLEEYSKVVSPKFYGKVSMSTKNGGVKISGIPEDFVVLGDLQINPSNLTIANLGSSNVVTKTNFEYIIKDDKRIYTIITQSDTIQESISPKPKIPKSSLPDVNLNVFIPKSVNLKIDLGAIGEIVAILGTTDPTIPMKYVMNDKNPEGQLFGELIIKQGSTLNSYKKMAATGTITFSTGKLDEPVLNLTAQYDGRIEDASNPIKYSVFIYITGTPVLPKVRFDYTINNMAPQGEQKKIEENALYLLLFGTLPGSSNIIDPTVMNKLGSAGISSIASRSISDLLLKTGVIESADVELNSEDFEKTKIQFKGKLFGSMNWSFGGNVSDLTKNNQIIIEIPLSINSKTFNQIVWLISYSTNLNSTMIDPDEKNWEVKFKIGGSW